MKRKWKWLFLPTILLLLSGCNLKDKESTELNSSEGSDENLQNNSTMVARNQLGDDFYRPALDEDGQYRTSKTRGMTF